MNRVYRDFLIRKREYEFPGGLIELSFRELDVILEMVKKAILEDMLKGCVIDYEGSWDRHIPLVKIVYNNRFQSRIGMAPYEDLYGRKCRTPLCWTKLSEKKVSGPDLVQETEEKVKMIR